MVVVGFGCGFGPVLWLLMLVDVVDVMVLWLLMVDVMVVFMVLWLWSMLLVGNDFGCGC